MAADARVPIRSDADIVLARQEGRRIAEAAGITGSNLTLIATAISELARNIFEYAGTGEIVVNVIERKLRRGVLVCARDQGPGIPDIELALRGGWSSSGSLGMGLSGARRLMDEFEIESVVGKGTTVKAIKWVP